MSTSGTVQAVDAARFTGYLYTALGHIHRPQQVGCPTVRYAGSPLCYSLDECGAQKSAVLVHIGANGAEPELCPCARCTPCATSPARWTS